MSLRESPATRLTLAPSSLDAPAAMATAPAAPLSLLPERKLMLPVPAIPAPLSTTMFPLTGALGDAIVTAPLSAPAPDWMDTDPATPSKLPPATTATKAPEPEPDDPASMDTAPAWASALLPEAIVIAPLTPAAALPEVSCTAPLRSAETPLEIETSPAPADVAMAKPEPASTVNELAPDAEAPTRTATSPLAPLTAGPVDNTMEPESPALALPVCTATAPVDAPAEGVWIVTDPELAEALAPLLMATLPPVDSSL
jgi:hypothetical protein